MNQNLHLQNFHFPTLVCSSRLLPGQQQQQEFVRSTLRRITEERGERKEAKGEKRQETRAKELRESGGSADSEVSGGRGPARCQLVSLSAHARWHRASQPRCGFTPTLSLSLSLRRVHTASPPLLSTRIVPSAYIYSTA